MTFSLVIHLVLGLGRTRFFTRFPWSGFQQFVAGRLWRDTLAAAIRSFFLDGWNQSVSWRWLLCRGLHDAMLRTVCAADKNSFVSIVSSIIGGDSIATLFGVLHLPVVFGRVLP